ncbi:hypothetical protein SDC9_135616 [bioreactor metagenome]|uniref:Uncharacterized protein n=1 Tax=bioreactor metagenome TaxID=1076179 RepID=A0A645DIU2_9ZZZZ
MTVTMTPAAVRAQTLKALPSLYRSSSECQHCPSRRSRSVASSQCGRPRSRLVTWMRCGARMMQPVVPVQCSGSRAASLSGSWGSPALPKMPSTKSRLLTRPPGTMKRTSIRCGQTPGTSGTTTGRISSETKVRAGVSEPAVQGSSSASSGGHRASSSSRPKTSLRTLILSSGIGSPPWAMWKTPAVVRRSLTGLCSTPLVSR